MLILPVLAIVAVGTAVGVHLVRNKSANDKALNTCGRVNLSPQLYAKHVQALQLVEARYLSQPNALVVDFLADTLRTVWPSCPWNAQTDATLVRADGQEISWKQLRAAFEGVTMAELMDPATALEIAENLDAMLGGMQGAAPAQYIGNLFA